MSRSTVLDVDHVRIFFLPVQKDRWAVSSSHCQSMSYIVFCTSLTGSHISVTIHQKPFILWKQGRVGFPAMNNHPQGYVPETSPRMGLRIKASNPEGCLCTADNFEIVSLPFSLSSTAHCELAKLCWVQSLTLSSPLFICLPVLLVPASVPCVLS